MGAEIIGEIELGGGAWLHADRGAVQLRCAFDVAFFRDHESLAVVVINADEVDPEAGVPGNRPARVARKNVHFTGLYGSEALLRGKRRVANLARIAEVRGGYGAAQVDVDAAPFPLTVRLGKSRQTGAYAALNKASFCDGLRRRLRVDAGRAEKG